MKKISLLIAAVFSFFLVGCSANHEKSSLNDKNTTQEITDSKGIINDENSKENNSDITNKKDSTKNNNDSSSGTKDTNTMQKNTSKISNNLNNKQISKRKSQKNIDKGKEASKKNCPFKIGMSIDTVKGILKKNNIKIENEIEVTSKPSDPSFGNKQLWIKDMTLEFDKNTNRLYSIKKD